MPSKWVSWMDFSTFSVTSSPDVSAPGDHLVPDDLRLTGLPRGLPAVSWHHFLPCLDVTQEVQKYFKILL